MTVGAALLILGIIISALWAVSFAGTFIRENTVLNGILIRPATSVNTSIQVIDTSRPVSLAIHVERNNGGTSTSNSGAGEGGQQIQDNTLRETVRNPNHLAGKLPSILDGSPSWI